ncbi:MAG: hypothetical protein OEY67_07080 [Gammaproteobacteria bacterium]|nr:hypothetical protein [Gammaproteobacteria bacterium]
MATIGILAYGSLLDDPGIELEPLITNVIKNVITPFPVEFARSSNTRDGAPTVIPVIDGGLPVNGQILVLKDEISLASAEDLLWRRETRKEKSGKHYTRPFKPNPDRVVVEKKENWQGLRYVLYTNIGQNIEDVTADKLADLAIESAKGKAGDEGKDGISYLINVNKCGIVTAFSDDYARAILRKTGADSLEAAREKVRNAAS